MPRESALGGSLGSVIGGLLAPPLCWGCDCPARRGEPLCRRCRGSLHRLTAEPVWLSGLRVWAPVAYSGPARDLVRALKFRGAVGVADAMAAQIAANAPRGLLDEEVAPKGPADLPAGGVATAAPPELLAGVTLVPVPLHPRRLRSRGYNQAAAIAAALARRAGVGMADCLARTGPAVTQVGRYRPERRAGPAGAIEVRGPTAAGAPGAGVAAGAPGAAVPAGAPGAGVPAGAPGAGVPARAPGAGVPARALLVDDVVTTGATLAACRSALLAAGSVEVGAVVFARTLGR